VTPKEVVMTDMYVLTNEIPYEGEDVLGVYSTLEASEQAMSKYWKANRPHKTNIWRFQVDANPTKAKVLDIVGTGDYLVTTKSRPSRKNS
jgi:hypothetical protein